MDHPARVDDVAARLRPVFDAEKRIRFAYLFGSAARDDAGEPRDIDVAVSVGTSSGSAPSGPAGDLSLAEEASLYALAAAVGCDVDLVVLERAPLWLQFRILGEGAVVVSRDEPGCIAFRERVERAFLDFRPYHEEYLAAVRERARRGTLSRG